MPAGERSAPAGPRGSPAAEPWRVALSGLQRNCQAFGSNLSRLQRTVAVQLGQFRPAAQPAVAMPVASLSQAAAGWSGSGGGAAAGGAVSREEVGRAAWTFLHTLAAQYPEKPSRQQQRDARNLVG